MTWEVSNGSLIHRATGRSLRGPTSLEEVEYFMGSSPTAHKGDRSGPPDLRTNVTHCFEGVGATALQEHDTAKIIDVTLYYRYFPRIKIPMKSTSKPCLWNGHALDGNLKISDLQSQNPFQGEWHLFYFCGHSESMSIMLGFDNKIQRLATVSFGWR